MESLENTDNLLTFISFPTRFGIAFIRQTSLSPLTKKSTSNEKEGSFPPNEEALERYLVTLFEDYNFKQNQRIHKGVWPMC